MTQEAGFISGSGTKPERNARVQRASGRALCVSVQNWIVPHLTHVGSCESRFVQASYFVPAWRISPVAFLF